MRVECIMVVDDAEADQFITRRTIQSFDPGITVIQANNGRQALEILESESPNPDVILLDINMPVMNGLEFLAEYSTRDLQPSVVVMLTSSDQDKDIQTSRQYACVKGYIVKPLNSTHLEELVRLHTSEKK